MAAIALLRAQVDPQHSLQIVHRALLGDDNEIAGIAAGAALQFGVMVQEAKSAICQRLAIMHPAAQQCVINSVKSFGGADAPELSEALANLLGNQETHPIIRGKAAEALGRLNGGAENNQARILDALEQKEPEVEVVSGAIEGLRRCGVIPPEAFEHFRRLFEDANPALRKLGAYGLSLVESRTNIAVHCLLGQIGREPEGQVRLEIVGSLGVLSGRVQSDLVATIVKCLIDRLGVEDDANVSEQMAIVLAQIGEPAQEPLLARIRERHTHNVMFVVMALAQLGDDPVRLLATELMSVSDRHTLQMILAALRSMGRLAEPASPILAKILDESDDDDIALQIIMTIFFSGAAGIDVIDALIRRVMNSPPDAAVGMWADRTLWSIREPAVPRLEHAIAGTTGSCRERLEWVLAEMRPQVTERLLYLEAARPEDLELFAAIGALMPEEGLRWDQIEGELEKRVRTKDFNPKGRSIKEGMLRSRIKELEECLVSGKNAIRLTTHGKNRVGHLTPEGKKTLSDVREFLRIKALRSKRIMRSAAYRY